MFFSETLQTSQGKVNDPAAFETRAQISFVLTLCVCLRQCFMSLLDHKVKREIFLARPQSSVPPILVRNLYLRVFPLYLVTKVKARRALLVDLTQRG